MRIKLGQRGVTQFNDILVKLRSARTTTLKVSFTRASVTHHMQPHRSSASYTGVSLSCGKDFSQAAGIPDALKSGFVHRLIKLGNSFQAALYNGA